MPTAKNGDGVSVHYTGKLSDGSVFDSSEGNEPLKFNIGAGMVIPGFENAIIGMEVGDKKTINIPKNEAYGEYRDEMIAEFSRNQFPEGMDVQIGMSFHLQGPDGSMLPVVVKEVKTDSVVIDGNHPLAGQDLEFDLELMEVGEPHQIHSACSGSCDDCDHEH